MTQGPSEAISKGISPQKAAELLGHDRDFILRLIRAGELPARDERRPGAKIPRYRIDPQSLVDWQRSRIVVPTARPATPSPPARYVTIETTGLLARRRADRLARQKQAAEKAQAQARPHHPRAT